jgi:hypothetical protein
VHEKPRLTLLGGEIDLCCDDGQDESVTSMKETDRRGRPTNSGVPSGVEDLAGKDRLDGHCVLGGYDYGVCCLCWFLVVSE